MMNIVIMRHGEAVLEANSDEERNLTAFGRKQSVQMAQWLAARLPRLDRVLVSPYVRAQQTWQTIRDFLPATTEVETLDDLVPHGHADRVADYLRALELQGGNDNVLLVSHLPLVGYVIADLCPQEGAPLFVTSGMAGLTLNHGAATLDWQESPSTVKEL